MKSNHHLLRTAVVNLFKIRTLNASVVVGQLRQYFKIVFCSRADQLFLELCLVLRPQEK